MKSNIALQISLHYSNHCTTIHDSFSMNKQCHRPYHESASNRGCARTNRRPRVDYTHFKIHPLEREILRDLQQRGTNLNLLHEGLSVQIHRGRGRFRSRGRAEFRANSDWNVRNERQLSRNRLYRIFVFKLRGGGKEADRSGHVRISPRNCFRGPHLVSCCWRGSVTSGMLLMRLPSFSSRAVIRRVLIWRQLWMRYVDLVWTDGGRF